MLHVNKHGQPIWRKGKPYPEYGSKCPCIDCGTCTTSCFYSTLHQTGAAYPGVIAPAAANVYHCKCTYAGETFDLYLDNTSEPISRFTDAEIWYDLDDPNPLYEPSAKIIYDSYCLSHPDDSEGQMDAYQTYLETRDKYLHYYTAEELAGQTGRWRSDTPLFAYSTFTNRKHALGLIPGAERPRYYVSATMELSCKNVPEEPLFDANGLRYAKDTTGWILSTEDCNFGPPRSAKLTLAYFNIFKFTAVVREWDEETRRYREIDTFTHWAQNITDKPVSLFGVDNVTVLGGAPFPLDAVGVTANDVPGWMDPEWRWSDHVNPSEAIEAPDFFQIYNFWKDAGVKKYSYFRHAGDYAYNKNGHAIALADFDSDTAGVCYMGTTTCENPDCDGQNGYTSLRDVSTDGSQSDPSLPAEGDIAIVIIIVAPGDGGSGATGGSGSNSGSTPNGSGGTTTTITVPNGSGGTTTTITVPNGDGTDTTITIDITPDPNGNSSSGTVTIDDGHGNIETIPTEVKPGSPWWEGKELIDIDIILDPGGGKSPITIGGWIIIIPHPGGGGGSTIGGNLSVGGIGDGASGAASGGSTPNGSGGTTTTITVPNGDGTDTTITIDITPDPDGNSSSGTATVSDGHGNTETIPIQIKPGSPWWKEKVPNGDPCKTGEQTVHYRMDYSETYTTDNPAFDSYTEYRWVEGVTTISGVQLLADSSTFWHVSRDGYPEYIEENSVALFASYMSAVSPDCSEWIIDTVGVGFAVSGGGGYRLNVNPQNGSIVPFRVPKKSFYFYGTIEYTATGSGTENFGDETYSWVKTVSLTCTIEKYHI